MNVRFFLNSLLLLSLSYLYCGDVSAVSTGTLTVRFGQTTEDSFKESHPNAVRIGFNKELNGNIYKESPNENKDVRRDIVFEDLGNVYVLFDQNKDLIALEMQFKSDYFGILSTTLTKKYNQVIKKQSLIGSNYMELYNDGVSIYLVTPSYFSNTSLFFVRTEEKEELLKTIPNKMLENESKILDFIVKKCFPLR
ncbi:MAG: hypothetical protein WAU54_07035 [Chania sp.]